jgi:hypothetical protein
MCTALVLPKTLQKDGRGDGENVDTDYYVPAYGVEPNSS